MQPVQVSRTWALKWEVDDVDVDMSSEDEEEFLELMTVQPEVREVQANPPDESNEDEDEDAPVFNITDISNTATDPSPDVELPTPVQGLGSTSEVQAGPSKADSPHVPSGPDFESEILQQWVQHDGKLRADQEGSNDRTTGQCLQSTPPQDQFLLDFDLPGSSTSIVTNCISIQQQILQEQRAIKMNLIIGLVQALQELCFTGHILLQHTQVYEIIVATILQGEENDLY
ncbi:hypothetical protein JAAARDRAFT_51758 [Jaapia argillacea MUCL 33604]|uniref:Uncharacterized protein n=1 Tax=Jaapia argillacea MUCL 33604 TaxID=933084 RepID=A0A067P3X4_9AGAM|nr:hypothetical protein JAAARDRAFT_51758 [Jaapia argillacea MUCL 33604]